MEFRQLEYFLAVSKFNSFTLAANALFVTQPTITTAIRALEDELGVKLFDRSQKRIVLTTEGEVFLNHVRQVMTHVSTALSEINDMKVLSKGVVKVAVSPFLMADFFPKAYSRFKKEFPSLEIQIREESSRTAQELLDNDEVEFALMHSPKNIVHFDKAKLFSSTLAVYLNKLHPGANGKVFLFAGLKDEPMVFCGENSFVPEIISNECAKYNFKPKILYSSSHLASIFGLVAANAALTVLPKQNYYLSPQVSVLPLSPVIEAEFFIYNKKNCYLSNAAQTFFNFICQYSNKLG